MKNNTNTQVIMQRKTRTVIPKESSHVQEVIDLGHKNLWKFSILGFAPMPKEHIRLGDWLVVPAEQDNSEIPDQAMERIQAIFNSGIRPKGFVVVHEAPMLLSPPEINQDQIPQKQWSLKPETSQKVIETLGVGASILGKVVLGTITAAGAIAAAIIPAIFLAGAVLIDPILIVVTEDDCWIEIDRWWV
jgi:hypothetical protein